MCRVTGLIPPSKRISQFQCRHLNLWLIPGKIFKFISRPNKEIVYLASLRSRRQFRSEFSTMVNTVLYCFRMQQCSLTNHIISTLIFFSLFQIYISLISYWSCTAGRISCNNGGIWCRKNYAIKLLDISQHWQTENPRPEVLEWCESRYWQAGPNFRLRSTRRSFHGHSQCQGAITLSCIY